MNTKIQPSLNNWSINLKEKFDWLNQSYKIDCVQGIVNPLIGRFQRPIALQSDPEGFLTPSVIKQSGVKYDDDKDPVELLDPLALEGLAKVLAFGAKKYAKHNWRGGLSYTRLIGAALRHTFEILKGKDIDPESGLPHVDHLGCCWMFLSNMMKTRPDMDDRWKETK